MANLTFVVKMMDFLNITGGVTATTLATFGHHVLGDRVLGLRVFGLLVSDAILPNPSNNTLQDSRPNPRGRISWQTLNF